MKHNFFRVRLSFPGIFGAVIIFLMTTLPLFSFAAIRPGAMLELTRKKISEGKFSEARSLADSVLTLSSNSLTKIEALDLLTDIHRALGNFQLCEKAFDQAETIFSTAPELSGYLTPGSPEAESFANMMLNKAQLELALGRYKECELSLDKANFPERSEGLLRKKGVMASSAFRQNNPLKALEILDSAISEAGNSPSLAMLLQNRGYILESLGRHDKAAADLKRALSLLSGKERGIALANIALVYSGMNDFRAALDSADAALRELEKSVGTNDADYLIALRKKGEIEMAAGRKKEAAATMKKFFEAERERLQNTLADMPPQMRLDYWTKEKPSLSKCFLVGETAPSLMMDVALTRRQISLPSLNNDKATDFSATYKDVRDLLAPGEAAVAFISYPEAGGEIVYAAVTLPKKGEPRFISLFDEQFINEPLLSGTVSISEAIESEDPAMKNLLYSDSTLFNRVWQPVLDALPADISTIHFAPEGVFHLWGIENLPRRNSTSASHSTRDNKEVNFVRHFSLLDINRKSGAASEPMLVAGGLDYDAVPDNLNSRRDYLNGEGDTPDHSAFSELCRSLGFAAGERIFSYLPGSAAEARRIAKTLPNVDLSNTLSEEEFKSNSSGYKTLHIATHGYSLDCGVGAGATLPGDSLAIDISLLRSGIALSGANVNEENPDIEDGIVSAREICDLNLGDVDMVVLSACQTAQGLITDESASGLIRALKIAGVNTIVASLWEVDDNATSLFMTTFHDSLSQGMTKADAFRKAQQQVAEYEVSRSVRKFIPATMAGKGIAQIITKPYTEPWYWAPFIIIDP